MTIFTCNSCNYNTKRKYDLKRHNNSIKHIKNLQRQPKKETVTTCSTVINALDNSFNDVYARSMFIQDEKINKLNDIVLTLLNENRNLQKNIVELVNQPKIVQHNKQFNIITFLNNDCKDAFNLSEFVKTLDITFEDLDTINHHGYIQSLKDSLIKNLVQMDERMRPIHCTDTKRKQFYVKEDNAWDKDKSCFYINNAIDSFNTSQMKLIKDWKDKNPAWKTDGKLQDKLNKLTREVAILHSDEGNKVRGKILNELCDATRIDKTL